jgi:hypothetical protein
MNKYKDWIEKIDSNGLGIKDCNTIGIVQSSHTTIEEWMEVCKRNNPEATDATIQEWYKIYQKYMFLPYT